MTTFSIFDVLRAFLFFTVGAHVLDEVIGYLWHRAAEHNGMLGEAIRYRHWWHHMKDYPVEDLRPTGVAEYKSAGSWSWYVLAVGTLLLAFFALPLHDFVPLALGGIIYAWYGSNYFHSAFHIERHWLNRFQWFRRLVKRHDIHHWAPCNYGILFFWMDWLFGTLREDLPTAKENIFTDLKGPAMR